MGWSRFAGDQGCMLSEIGLTLGLLVIKSDGKDKQKQNFLLMGGPARVHTNNTGSANFISSVELFQDKPYL